MDKRTIQILFALLRSAIRGTKLTEAERNNYSPALLQDLLKISSKHDVVHLLVFGLKQNELIPKEHNDIEKCILNAVYRYERIRYEYETLCEALEKSQIPFLPLKGAVLRKYYPEPWMRTSCDIDILIHEEDLDAAVVCLTNNLQYSKNGRTTHDMSLLSGRGERVELHFDLIEEGRANNAIQTLKSVWDHCSLHKTCSCRYDMTDEFFYFYHIAHMAKHFENGGCGIRPFIDLWILDHMENANHIGRDALLEAGGLLRFAVASRNLSEIWFGGAEMDDLSLQMQNLILHGGAYGTSENRVAFQQKKKGGRLGYIISRVFIPYEKLVRYYPILKKYRLLTPLMQVRRWFMLSKPRIADMAKQEISANMSVDKSKADEMKQFLERVGLS